MFLTVDELLERIGPVEADNVAGEGPRSARRIDRTKIETAIGGAGELVNGYIRARYPAPIAPVPEILKSATLALALYDLRLKTGDMSGVGQEIKARYDDALRLLRDVQSGRLAIDANQPGEANRPHEERPVLVAGRPSRADAILDEWPLNDGGKATLGRQY